MKRNIQMGIDNASINVLMRDDEKVIADRYCPHAHNRRSAQSEAELEHDFVEQLVSFGYEQLAPHGNHEAFLKQNLREQFERLNASVIPSGHLTDAEWERFFQTNIDNRSETYIDKVRRIQDPMYRQLTLELDDGTQVNVKLIDTSRMSSNRMQVIEQLVDNGGSSRSRYDVTILMNGLPVVMVELKRRGIAIQNAFEQIGRYAVTSFTGLLGYLHLFVISNGANTRYYSITTRRNLSMHNVSQPSRSRTKISNRGDFSFTSEWSDADNNHVNDLIDFTSAFFPQRIITQIILRYCVLNANDELLVMRPYQICAVERIVNRIATTVEHKELLGTPEAGGYIFHATGSGKTLTSFAAARIISTMPSINRVVFVVDRCDLDAQTVREYQKFQDGCVTGTVNTKALDDALSGKATSGLGDGRLVVTTIQKLYHFVQNNPRHDAYAQHVVFIFDECHRSQFGMMRREIGRKFKKSHFFGFTGTPIFNENARTIDGVRLTTDDVFGECLHRYTMANAINDGKTLPFAIDSYKTIEVCDDVKDGEKRVSDIDRTEAYHDKRRISEIVRGTLQNFPQKTMRKHRYELRRTNGEKVHVNGYGAMFATDSIDAACLYYEEFKRQLTAYRQNDADETSDEIVVALVYTRNVDNEIIDGDDTLDNKSVLAEAIDDYNKRFNTHFSATSTANGYITDLQRRIADRHVDIVIVVNMLLTGFDAPCVNTLYVDKELRSQMLIQAYSRTNRTFDDLKRYGNIVCYRDLQLNTDEAIRLFCGDDTANVTVVKKTFSEARDEYLSAANNLVDAFPYDDIDKLLFGRTAQNKFIKAFGLFSRKRQAAMLFTEFYDDEKCRNVVDEFTFTNYASKYLDIHAQLIRADDDDEKESIVDDLSFCLEFVKQSEIDVDYIVSLLEDECGDMERFDRAKKKILDQANASPTLHAKINLIKAFLLHVNPAHGTIYEQWRNMLDEFEQSDLDMIIARYNLNADKTRMMMNEAYANGDLDISQRDALYLAVNRGSLFARHDDVNRVEMGRSILNAMNDHFLSYCDLM